MKMVKMINKILGNEMWVAEDRVKEYKEAGHKLASGKDEIVAEKPDVEEETEEVAKDETSEEMEPIDVLPEEDKKTKGKK